MIKEENVVPGFGGGLTEVMLMLLNRQVETGLEHCTWSTMTNQQSAVEIVVIR